VSRVVHVHFFTNDLFTCARVPMGHGPWCGYDASLPSATVELTPCSLPWVLSSGALLAPASPLNPPPPAGAACFASSSRRLSPSQAAAAARGSLPPGRRHSRAPSLPSPLGYTSSLSPATGASIRCSRGPDLFHLAIYW